MKPKPKRKRWRKIPNNLVVVKGDPRKAFKLSDDGDRRYVLPVEKVVRKVNRDAWIFKPDVTLVVAADFAHGRVVVRETVPLKPSVAGRDEARFEGLKHKLESIVREYVVQERLHRGLHVVPCKHPFFRIKKKSYAVETDKAGEPVKLRAWFCTKCGVKIREDKHAKVISEYVTKAVNPKPRAPRVRRILEAL